MLRTGWSVIWRCGLFVLTWGVLVALLFAPLGSRIGAWASAHPMRTQLFADAAGAVTMLAATWLMTRFVDRRRFVTIGFAAGNVVRDLAAGLAVGVAWLGASVGGAWLPAVNVVAAGMPFGLAYRATGNLWFPIGIHFAWNLLLGPVLGLTVSGTRRLVGGWRMLENEGPAVFTGGAFGLEGGLVVTLTTATLAAGLALAERRITRRPSST